MNRDRSNERIRTWKSQPNPLKRVVLVLERTLNAPPERIFPLLCPTREYDWIADWECELLHSESGHGEPNVVFRTRLLGVEELWVCTHYEPPEEIHYLRLAPGLLTRLEITLVDLGDERTRIRWSLTGSALSEEMNRIVADLEEDGGRRPRLEHLLDDLDHYLATGEMRKI